MSRAVLVFAALMMLAAAARAAPAGASPSAQAFSGPLVIEADAMHLDHARRVAVFTGHVRLERGDFRLECRRLTARYRADGKLKRAEAQGGVRIRQGEVQGHAGRAWLDDAAGTLKLLDDAVLEQPGRRVEGAVIVHDLNTRQTEVLQGGPAPSGGADAGGRPRMIIEDDGAAGP